MIIAGGYQHIRMYDMISNTPIMNLEGVTKNITRIGLQEDGRWMYTGGEDCRVRIWDMKTQICKRAFDCQTVINAVALHPNQVEMAIGSQGGRVYLWDVKSDAHEQCVPEVEASVQDVAISPNGMFMAAVNNKGNCYIWNLTSSCDNSLSTLQPRQKIEAHKRYALRCKFSPDSNYLVTCAGDSTAKLWKTPDFTLYRTFDIEFDAWVWDAAFSADSRRLFTGKILNTFASTLEYSFNHFYICFSFIGCKGSAMEYRKWRSRIGLYWSSKTNHCFSL